MKFARTAERLHMGVSDHKGNWEYATDSSGAAMRNFHIAGFGFFVLGFWAQRPGPVRQTALDIRHDFT